MMKGRAVKEEAPSLKESILAKCADYGVPAVNVPPDRRAEIDQLCSQLEKLNPTSSPATDNAAALAGTWRVMYSDAVPPSNGQFGPFTGDAFQIVSIDEGVYENRLDIGTGKLVVSLKADWTVRDDETWRVAFRTLTFKLLGLSLPTVEFPAGTERTWCMTFVDETMRLVRAGVDGGRSTSRDLGLVDKEAGEAKDAFLFVMTKDT